MTSGPLSEVAARADLALTLGDAAEPRADGVLERVWVEASLVMIGPSTKGPRRLNALKSRSVGRKVDQLDAARHGEVGGMEGGIVQQQHDALVGPALPALA